ncbi:efflux RND transporter permease subunit [Halosquirtibacter xylanolyticus]|uniref:efflux RND transporter permease subunit n=1 Tax=Halosquirtibacter xylanolyticus TaxID=3374599 RepID=UPI003749F3BF|nr:efflux RND transporter permease subunit [Prolixibacteraceae bacterium]
MKRVINFFLSNRLFVWLLIGIIIAIGLAVSPFTDDSHTSSAKVAVDAIPDIGDNQQIIYTKWSGRSPRDIEDQISYPLTTTLLGIPGVKTIRSASAFGFSTINIIFTDDVDYYWSRSRIIEKLNSLPPNTLPLGVKPNLGPDATGLGQVFWYTLEGQDPKGANTGGWDLSELRSIQDYIVKYGLMGTTGVSEVASIGGFVKEYQIDLNVEAMQAYRIGIKDIVKAVKESNIDVGAQTMEINKVEYFIRGLGYIQNVDDLKKTVIKTDQLGTPIFLNQIANISLGPANRRGILDKNGVEAVGGVVVARYGANPMQVLKNIKEKISEISPSLPSKELSDGTMSQIKIVPFYDRSKLIQETLFTLKDALYLEIIITILVVVIMLQNLKTSLIISTLLPLSILLVFIAMRYFNITANIVSLSGIAIAIGTLVDIGIVLIENLIKHISYPENKGKKWFDVVLQSTHEVGSAILTSIATTIVSFIPVFSLQAAEGKLFHPLAFTKTFALIGALLVALFILPTLSYYFFRRDFEKKQIQQKQQMLFAGILFGLGLFTLYLSISWIWSAVAFFFAVITLAKAKYPSKEKKINIVLQIAVIIGITIMLGIEWNPLGYERSSFQNILFVTILIGTIMGAFKLFEHYYPSILNWCLKNKKKFLAIPLTLIATAWMTWVGFERSIGYPFSKNQTITQSSLYQSMTEHFPGIGNEFMPALDEGDFLLMPTSMPHAGVAENRRVLQELDLRTNNIPEVDGVLGKAGRVNSALDPAPLSMYENIIHYKSKFAKNQHGEVLRFKIDQDNRFITREHQHIAADSAFNYPISSFIPDNKHGKPLRQWRSNINSKEDIWAEITKATKLPGVTSAPKLQPIETRLIMLQTGMRASIGIKVLGNQLDSIQAFGLALEQTLKEVPQIVSTSIFADRIVGKPYMLINWNRQQLAHYGISIGEAQKQLEIAIGGIPLEKSIEGRERYDIRVRYSRDDRKDPEALKRLLIANTKGKMYPIGQIATIEYEAGPQMIKSEDGFLISYVIFDKQNNISEVEAVEAAQDYIKKKIDMGVLHVPYGVHYKFSGNYENQIRASRRLAIAVPLCLALIFIILYLQFKSVDTALMVFTSITVAFSGAFILIGLYGSTNFLDINIFGVQLNEIFRIHPINLSVAVWVGFIALFGISTDDGVLLATYLDQSFKKNKPKTKDEIHQAVLMAGKKRIRPALMTTATTILALLPVITSTGRGADIMLPMSIPSIGGMIIALIAVFIVPVLYSWRAEISLKKK